ncbi:cyanate lyase C-terminal domain-containing protein [Pavlovales sp. CCMP2436]|nr:cyanate lyase C-terminal domain-containing protein [Pavlovales sp. CCMP2436]
MAVMTTSAAPPQHGGESALEVAERIERVLAAKTRSGKSYDQLAGELGVTNTYAAQLLLGQAQLRPETRLKLEAAISGLDAADLFAMTACPMRSFDPAVLQEPLVYRFYEAITHYSRAIKLIVNEQCGDGIMSAIDFYLDVGTSTGVNGEKRVVVTMNGKFLPHIEQRAANNMCPSPRD